MCRPWNDWIPGVLNNEQIKRLYAEGFIDRSSALEDKHLDESSVDLLLSGEGYWMKDRYSVKPSSRERYSSLIVREASAERLSPNVDKTFTLQCRNT